MLPVTARVDPSKVKLDSAVTAEVPFPVMILLLGIFASPVPP